MSLAIMIIAAPILRYMTKQAENIKREAIVYSSLALMLGSGLTVLALTIGLPQFIYPDRLISRPVDFVSAILFIVAFAMIFKKFWHRRDIFSGSLLICILLNIGGQIYMSFSKQLFDIFFDIAHFANILSYCAPVLGIAIQSLQEMRISQRESLRSQQANQQLVASEQQLKATNQQLISNEEERKQSELKFRTLYESSGDAIMLVTADEGFFDCNDATVRLFGCKSKEEFCSKHPSEVSPATQPCGRDSMTLANERMATAVKQGSNSFEWVHQKIDGSDFPADVLLNAMELDGKKVLQAVVRDITERKQVEDRIKSVMAKTERMNKLMMGREMRVIEMKREVNALLAELGRQPQYKSVLKDETVVLSDKAE